MNEVVATGAGRLGKWASPRSRLSRTLLNVREIRTAPAPAFTLEAIACFIALAGVLASVLAGFHPREWQASGSDLKTLYASAACFHHHIDPYNFDNLATVFQSNDVVPPSSWYAHAPVYPPFTLAVITPLTFIPMVGAVYLWIVVSALVLAYAAFLLVQASAQTFHLSRPWRLALVALFAASPLLSFSLEMCNVSAVVAGLCIISVAAGPSLGPFAKSSALCLALLLKPHLAIWVIVALVLSRARPDRALAVRAISLCAGVALSIALWMAAHHQLQSQFESYKSMVMAETGGGSMAAGNNDLIAVAAQITSLQSLLGYWVRPGLIAVATVPALLVGVVLMIVATRRAAEGGESTRLMRIGAWCLFGLIATYHRAHDAIVVVLVLPYLLARLRSHRFDPSAWISILLLALMGAGPTWEFYEGLAASPHIGPVADFLLFRQSAFVTVALLAILICQMLLRRREAALPVEAYQLNQRQAVAA